MSQHTSSYLTLAQYEVIGQNLTDITNEDDLPIITKNLQSSTTPPSTHLDGRTELQHRQFFVRIKSSLTPGRMQLSRFIVSLRFSRESYIFQGYTELPLFCCYGDCVLPKDVIQISSRSTFHSKAMNGLVLLICNLNCFLF